ncbi:hypothetical protein [Actinoplanes rectilineatus]|uniref:hypothetical protein n=1 Tax=Actinoplanes rectilineatus TaxID=113571 RepID=UPI0012FC8F0E|nr:hypothetical protein [Actinoplanes rectilineatus]
MTKGALSAPNHHTRRGVVTTGALGAPNHHAGCRRPTRYVAGPPGALTDDPALARGLNTHRGLLTHQGVAEATGLPGTDVVTALGS